MERRRVIVAIARGDYYIYRAILVVVACCVAFFDGLHVHRGADGCVVDGCVVDGVVGADTAELRSFLFVNFDYGSGGRGGGVIVTMMLADRPRGRMSTILLF